MPIDFSKPIDPDHPLNRKIIHWYAGIRPQSPTRTLYDIANTPSTSPGTLTNGPVWTTDYPSNNPCLSYDGTDDYVTMGDVGDVEGISALTIEAWVYPLTISGGTDGLRYVTSKEDGGGANMILRQLTGGDKCQFYISDGSLMGPQEIGGFGVNQWFHLCATYRAGVGLDFYSNGIQYNPTGFTSIGTMTTNTAPLAIGSLPSNTGRAFFGRIRDVIFHQYKFSQSEAWIAYEEALKGNPTRLRRYSNKRYFFAQPPAAPSPYITGNVIDVDQEFIGDSPYVLGTNLTAGAATGGDIPSEGGSGLTTLNSVNVFQFLNMVQVIPSLTQNVISVDQSVTFVEHFNTDTDVGVGSFCSLYLGDAPNVLVGNRYRR
jgi:hypothetical protein